MAAKRRTNTKTDKGRARAAAKISIPHPGSAFLCYCKRETPEVSEVIKFLNRNFEHIFYYEEGQVPTESF